MRVTKLHIKNIGLIADETIPLDLPLILFYGDIRQGKTTILNAVRWLFGGAFPSDIIRHGATEASVELEFVGGSISRSFYVAKDKSVKAREITFIRDGKPVTSPVAEIKRLLNPFLLNQDHLKNMTELERKRFFTELFNVDTAALDTELTNAEKKASDLRITIKGYGDIDMTEYKVVDVEAAKKELAELKASFQRTRQDIEKSIQFKLDGHQKTIDEINRENEVISAHNTSVSCTEAFAVKEEKDIVELEKKLADAKARRDDYRSWLKDNPKKQLLQKPAAPDVSEMKSLAAHEPDTTGLDNKIADAAANNVRAEQYLKNKQRAATRDADNAELLKLEGRAREIRKEKIAALKGISDKCGIEGLEFDETGNFVYQGTQAGMLSTSQIMVLSSQISSLFPAGFSLELIDRAESLGKSIFSFVERAQAEKKTILATIVGEKPAKVPENIGVFVVTNGEVKE